jgi:hypothetical protein
VYLNTGHKIYPERTGKAAAAAAAAANNNNNNNNNVTHLQT